MSSLPHLAQYSGWHIWRPNTLKVIGEEMSSSMEDLMDIQSDTAHGLRDDWDQMQGLSRAVESQDVRCGSNVIRYRSNNHT